MKRRAVFLDRDGVINRAVVDSRGPRPPRTMDELEVPGDVPEALSRLREAGFLNVIVTNQPDVARGHTTRAFVEQVHAGLAGLPLDAFYVCWHDDADGCDCRKPRAGMFTRAAGDLGIDLTVSYMVGDRAKDIEAGNRAGCTSIYIRSRHDSPEGGRAAAFAASSLGEAAAWILEHSKRRLDKGTVWGRSTG